MEHVLYADILFFINFSMDFITLYLTSRLTSGPPAGVRSAVAAVIGGIYGTFAVAVELNGAIGVIVTGVVSLAMVIIAYGFEGISLLLRRAAVFWGFAALLGGVMTAICSLGSAETPSSPAGGTALLFAGSTVCIIFIRIISRFSKRKTVTVKIELDGKRTEFTALCDSGNLVRDPLSGRPVILVDRSLIAKIAPGMFGGDMGIGDTMMTKIRMIPIRGIGGSGVVSGFIPDSAKIRDGARERTVDAVIAVTDFGETFFGGYPANFPSSIL